MGKSGHIKQEDQEGEPLLRRAFLKTNLERGQSVIHVDSWGVGMFLAEGTDNAKALRQKHMQVDRKSVV